MTTKNMRLILAKNTHQKNRKKSQFIFDKKQCQNYAKIFDKNKYIKYIKEILVKYTQIKEN